MVLLKNQNEVLPLKAGEQRVALIGPLVDNRSDLLGTWASAGRQEDAGTVLEAFRTYLNAGSLTYVEGCSIQDEKLLDLQAAVDAARQADVVVLVVGESRELSGEAHSRVHLGLPGRQQELVDALSALGKPLVAVVMSGRPLVIPELAQKADALLAAWHGGIRAGQAVADILFGAASPSGKLTASWPRAEGQIPVYYAHKATGRPEESAGTTQFNDPFRSIYLDEPNAPLFSFGMGLSYTQYEYSTLEVLTPSLPLDGVLKVRATVRNAGSRAGVEVVQLYVRDLVGSVTRPVKELKGFQRVELAPGEERQVEFTVPVSELGFHNTEMCYVIEPGWFKVWVGPDSTRGLEAEFELK
jgi:beta-glucosidase